MRQLKKIRTTKKKRVKLNTTDKRTILHLSKILIFFSFDLFLINYEVGVVR
jgi:hypothetical protein